MTKPLVASRNFSSLEVEYTEAYHFALDKKTSACTIYEQSLMVLDAKTVEKKKAAHKEIMIEAKSHVKTARTT